MEPASTTHWLLLAFISLAPLLKFVVLALGLLALLLSPVLGIVRGLRNSSAMNRIASLLIPFYGLIYFLCRPRREVVDLDVEAILGDGKELLQKRSISIRQFGVDGRKTLFLLLLLFAIPAGDCSAQTPPPQSTNMRSSARRRQW